MGEPGYNITTPVIIAQVATRTREYPRLKPALDAIVEKQIQAEAILLSSGTTCNVAMQPKLREHLPGLNAPALKDLTNLDFIQPAVPEAIACIADSLFYTGANEAGSFVPTKRVKAYLQNLRQIGSESAEGVAMVADFDGASDFMILKAAQDPKNDQLAHEAVVGLYGTNNMRRGFNGLPGIGNFVYTYGAMKCSPPLIGDDKKVITYCLNNDNLVNYVLLENINPSISVRQYLATATVRQFLTMYVQICYAVHYANKAAGFSHYDLHYENVLMRTLQEGQAFHALYPTENGTEFINIEDGKLAVIIDFGQSYIEVATQLGKERQGVHTSGLYTYSIVPDHSYLAGDLYKFLCWCGLAAWQADNEPVRAVVGQILRYWNKTEDVDIILSRQVDYKYNLPYTPQTAAFDFNSYMKYIRGVTDCSFISKAPIGISLNCESMCLTKQQVFDIAGMNPFKPLTVPTNLMEFYDLYVQLGNQQRLAERDQLKEAFAKDLNMHFTVQLTKLNALVAQIRTDVDNTRVFDMNTLSLEQNVQYDVMMVVRKMFMSAAKIINDIAELHFFTKIGDFVAGFYQTDDDRYGAVAKLAALGTLKTNFERDVRPAINKVKAYVAIDSKYLEEVESSPIMQQAIARDSRLQWYYGGREVWDMAVGRGHKQIVYDLVPGYSVLPNEALAGANVTGAAAGVNPLLQAQAVRAF